MESSQIKGLFIIVLAAMFAVYLGVAAATASFEAIAWVAGFMGLAVVLALGRQIWCLIPLGFAFQGTINGIPGSPPMWALGMAVVLTMFVIRFAMRKPEFIFKLDLLDIAVLLQVVVIGQAYARNPTGLLMFGGQLAGGKPYFIFAASVMAYFCLAVAKPEARMIKWVVIGMIAIGIGDGLLSTISDRSGTVASLVVRIYSNVNLAVARGANMTADLDNARAGGGLSQLGRALVIPCFCLMRPLKSLSPFRPWILLIVLAGVAAVFLSGFRSNVAYLAVVFVASALIRRTPIDVAVVSLVGLLGLAVLLMSGKVRSLPFGAQRVLSVLPIEVSAAARDDAENSTRWRMEMWELALTSDRYIQHKVLGDGFALSAVEMRAILDAAEGYESSITDSQETMLAQGTYHGFHVETIRFTGVVGLLAAIFLMGVAFQRALKMVRYYRNSKLFPYVAYLCIPALIYPLWSLLVFGSYRVEFPVVIASSGMLKMLDNLRRAELATSTVDDVVPTPAGRVALPAPAFAGAGR